MKKISQKPSRSVVIAALIGVGIASAIYVPAVTVKPVRTVLYGMVEGTMIERFLPYDDDDDHDDYNHEREDVIEIALNLTAAKNIGLGDSAIVTVEAVDFYKSFSFPGVVVERPGFSTIIVPSPVSGVVTKIYHESGVAVEPGEPLFDILLNQQELVKTQTEFLTLLKKREINAAELTRLSGLDPQIIPRQRRELEYEKLQIDSEIEIQKNILLLQGLSEADVTESLKANGAIIRSMTVYAPPFENEGNIASTAHADDEVHIFTIDELFVSVGKNIAVGDSLCQLTDYCKLAIRGKVFAINEKALVIALNSRSRVTAIFEGDGTRETVPGMLLRSVDNRIDTVSGTLFCYVDLKNRFTDYEVNGESNLRRYIKWHFKPGQRCELHVEYEPLPNCIVLPVDAVAKDFQEMYVFEWVGNEDDKKIWRKTPVHVIHRTKDAVVIANDGSIFPGAQVAARGANFILAAIEAANQTGADTFQGCDGHSH
ncbi:MAG: efflux RND transporter periplasmic adaptor subunit [Planctomycetaceae bacterium]|nr:efflux RND transporter periplasmic adaptor subunit [Planctomycetaceae bacterium]